MISGTPIPAAPDTTPNDRLFAILSYIFAPLVGIIVLLVEDVKNKPFPRYHAIQSIGFVIVAWIYGVAINILLFFITAITAGLGAILGCCTFPLMLLPIVPIIFYAYKASQNLYFEIPWLTNFMVQQGWLARP